MAGERRALLLETSSYGLNIYTHTITPCNKSKNRAVLSNLFFYCIFFAAQKPVRGHTDAWQKHEKLLACAEVEYDLNSVLRLR